MDPEKDEPLEAIYREQAPRLWRAVYAYAGDRDVASDAVAEAFAQYLRRGTQVRSARAWLWRAAFRIAAGELASRDKAPANGEPSNAGEDAPGARELLMVLEALPARQRATLILHYYEGYKTREIAKILGSSPATVRVHLSQGRKRLQAMLEDEH